MCTGRVGLHPTCRRWNSSRRLGVDESRFVTRFERGKSSRGRGWDGRHLSLVVPVPDRVTRDASEVVSRSSGSFRLERSLSSCRSTALRPSLFLSTTRTTHPPSRPPVTVRKGRDGRKVLLNTYGGSGRPGDERAVIVLTRSGLLNLQGRTRV